MASDKTTKLRDRHIGLQAWLISATTDLGVDMVDFLKNGQLIHGILQQDISILVEAYRNHKAPPVLENEQLAKGEFKAVQSWTGN